MAERKLQNFNALYRSYSTDQSTIHAAMMKSCVNSLQDGEPRRREILMHRQIMSYKIPYKAY